jgi:EXPERA (EXPanded EBP superfamily)
MYWQVIEWINMFCLTPYGFVIIAGFVLGWNRIRMPTVVVSSFTFYSLCICIGCTLFGDSPSPDVPMFLAIYVPYLVFPLTTIWRLWDEKPFSESSFKAPRHWFRKLLDFFNVIVMLITFAVYFYYIVRWFRLHTHFLDHIFDNIAVDEL